MSLEFRPIKEGRRLAAWVKGLNGKSGVYLIRQTFPSPTLIPQTEIVYIGESHTGRLLKTLLRHFQHWEGPTSGPTFPPSKCEVAIVRTRPERAEEMQNALIEEYRPRLNVEANPEAK